MIPISVFDIPIFVTSVFQIFTTPLVSFNDKEVRFCKKRKALLVQRS